MPEASKIAMEALNSSICWHIGSVISTRLSNIDCKSERKSCLKRVILKASRNMLNLQNSLNSFEYLGNIIKSESVGIEKMRCMCLKSYIYGGKKIMDKKYTGIFSANTTPFNADGTLNVAGMKSEIDYMLKSGIKGFFIGGTYGEGPMMSSEEYEEYINAFSEFVNGRGTIIAQIGANSLKRTVRQAEFAEAAKVDSVAAITPMYYPHDDAAIEGYYNDLCKSTELPVFIYNNPFRSGNRLSPSLVRKLSKIPGICGMNDSSDSLTEFCRYKMSTDPDFNLMIANDDMTLSAFMMGAQGGVIVLAGLFPELYVSMYEEFLEGNFETARELQNRAIAIRMILKTGPYISTYKAVLNLLERPGGYSKKPIRMPSLDEMKVIEKGLKEWDCL